MDVFDRVCHIISQQLRSDDDLIDEDADIVEELGADSLDVVGILMAIEENFGRSMPDEEVIGLRTVRELSDYVEGLIEE